MGCVGTGGAGGGALGGGGMARGGGIGAYRSFSLSLNFFISFVLNNRFDWRDRGGEEATA